MTFVFILLDSKFSILRLVFALGFWGIVNGGGVGHVLCASLMAVGFGWFSLDQMIDEFIR